MSKSVKLNSDLWKRIEECSKQAGYSSPQELVEHVLEREISRLENAKDEEAGEEEVERRLRGLGYLE